MRYHYLITILLFILGYQLFGETFIVQKDGGVRSSQLMNFFIINVGSKVDFPEDHHVNLAHVESLIVRNNALSDRFVEIRLDSHHPGITTYRIPDDVQSAVEILEVLKKAQVHK